MVYAVTCDAAWRTRRAAVTGWIGDTTVTIERTVDDEQRWYRNGQQCTAVEGCLDVDLEFTPATNLLPTRRLALAVGEDASVRAAWLRFPGLELEPLAQRYRREADRRYRYESAGGAFTTPLTVNDLGVVVRYGEYWVAEVPS